MLGNSVLSLKMSARRVLAWCRSGGVRCFDFSSSADGAWAGKDAVDETTPEGQRKQRLYCSSESLGGERDTDGWKAWSFVDDARAARASEFLVS